MEDKIETLFFGLNVLVGVRWAWIHNFIITYEKDHKFVFWRMTLSKTLFFFFLNLLVGIRWPCIQNFIILTLVVFEIAMKKTLNLCFGRRPKLSNYFLLQSLSWGQMSLHTKFHHPSSFSFWDSYEEDLKFVFRKTA